MGKTERITLREAAERTGISYAMLRKLAATPIEEGGIRTERVGAAPRGVLLTTEAWVAAYKPKRARPSPPDEGYAERARKGWETRRAGENTAPES